jgi:hypothetical protein
MEAGNTPHFHPGEHVLPPNRRIPSVQDLLVHTRPASAKAQRPPFSLSSDLELHPPPYRLGHAECATQTFHLEVFLRGGPLCEAGFEGVVAVEGDGRGIGGGGGSDLWANA